VKGDASVELVLVEATDHALHLNTVLNLDNYLVVELWLPESLAYLFEGSLELVLCEETAAKPVKTIESVSQLD
jgi:hypothetical protein